MPTLSEMGILYFLTFKSKFGHISESTRKILSGFQRNKKLSIKSFQNPYLGIRSDDKKKLIDKSLLSNSEINQINKYHKLVNEKIAPLITK